jgi:sulfiredoxin
LRSVEIAEARVGSGKDQKPMMKAVKVSIAQVYVPVKRRATFDPEKARAIAQSILETGQEAPILVRQDGNRLVLVEGLHRLEACRQLGEEQILAYLVAARRH